MRVYIDGKEYADCREDADTSSILNAVRGELSRKGRVITEIRLDGVAMEEEAFVKVTGGLGVRFSSQPIRELVRESLDQALKYVPRLMNGLKEVAFHFEKNEIGIGQGQLVEAADGLDWLLIVFRNCSALLGVQEEQEETADSGFPQFSGLSQLKKNLSESLGHLETLHREGKHLEMAQGIRRRLIPQIEQFSMHLQRLHDLGVSTQ